MPQTYASDNDPDVVFSEVGVTSYADRVRTCVTRVEQCQQVEARFFEVAVSILVNVLEEMGSRVLIGPNDLAELGTITCAEPRIDEMLRGAVQRVRRSLGMGVRRFRLRGMRGPLPLRAQVAPSVDGC